MVEFEGWHHAYTYLRNVMDIMSIDGERGDGTFRLSTIYARHLAGRLMRWEGPFEVARIKAVKGMEDVLPLVDTHGRDLVVRVEALLQPNFEEMYGMIPKYIHDTICRLIPSWQEYVERRRYDGKPITIDLTSVVGYLMLWLLWRLSFLHRHSIRYHREMGLVGYFTNTIRTLAGVDYELACMVADCAQYIRGFAHVRARNIDAFKVLVEHVVMKGIEMDRALADNEYRIARAALRAAISMITLDGEGKDDVIRFMDELYLLFREGRYDALYSRLAFRQFVPAGG